MFKEALQAAKEAFTKPTKEWDNVFEGNGWGDLFKGNGWGDLFEGNGWGDLFKGNGWGDLPGLDNSKDSSDTKEPKS